MKKFGEIVVDHRASPGIPENMAVRLGYHPSQVKEGALFEAATMTCVHCNRPVIRNPMRTRERAWCAQCGCQYICDWCDLERHKPDYVHRSFHAVVDLMQTGRFTYGSTSVSPVLIPKKEG
jgi:hypothetical protein